PRRRNARCCPGAPPCPGRAYLPSPAPERRWCKAASRGSAPPSLLPSCPTQTFIENWLARLVRILIRLPRFSDLPVIANRPWMERQKGVAIDVGGNSGRRGGMRLHHFLVVLEDCSDHVVDEVIW